MKDNKINQVIEEFLLLSKRKATNIQQIKKYITLAIKKNSPITLFNWESFDVKATQNNNGEIEWITDFSIKGTNFYKNFGKEKVFIKKAKKIIPRMRFIKIIPDEQLLLIWPEIVLQIGKRKLDSNIERFKKNLSRFIKKKVSDDIQVFTISEFLNQSSLYRKTYAESFNLIKNSIKNGFPSPYITKNIFNEDVNFRKKHYSKEPILDQAQIKIYSLLMFALFAGETSLLLALEQDSFFPNLILVNNEPLLTIKKYETLTQYFRRKSIPKIFPFE
jgi:hypothetical protein